MKSVDSGNSWENFNNGLPKSFIPVKMKIDSRENLFLITHNSGIFKFDKNNNVWRNININDFLVKSSGNFSSEYRKISAISIDDENPDSIVLATKHTIFKTRNGGKSWNIASMKGLDKKNYITALAIRGKGPAIYAGTSYNGLFRRRKARFVKTSSRLPREPYAGNLSFYEEIAEIVIDRESPGIIYAGINFSGGVYMSSNSGRVWRSLNFPLKKGYNTDIYDMKLYGGSLFVSSDAGLFRLDLKTWQWYSVNIDRILTEIPDELEPLSIFIIGNSEGFPSIFYHINDYMDPKSRVLRQKASNRTGIYASIPSIRRNFDGIMKTLKKCEFNSVVIDMKDDFGDLYFPSKNKYAIESGAVKRFPKIIRVLKTLKENNIYAIARVVVFKDKNLYRAYNNKYAIWNKKTNKPWRGNSREFWVDPHSDFVRKYNIDLAAEIQNIGFDEIQFDYIRFPSDGPINQCRYRYNKLGDMYKSEVMCDFLRGARREIDIPISVDIYGYNAWYHIGNKIGQDIEEFARIVDVICPMVYPSHFGKIFYMKGPRELRPYRIVFDSGKRAAELARSGAVIRPYIQAFRLHSPTWGTGYIKNQARGALDSGCGGYTFWNARGDYKMVRKALAKSDDAVRH